MTLTTIGLSLRDEVLVKSFLQVVGGTTLAEWRYIDEEDADLALCEPESLFARNALARCKLAGRPSCVGIARGTAPVDGYPMSIHMPLRVGEFVALLDRVAESADRNDLVDAKLPSTRAVDAASRTLAGLLHELQASESRQDSVWRLEAGAVAAFVMFPERTYSNPGALAAADLVAALGRGAPGLVRLSEEAGAGVRARNRVRPLDELLWQCGQRASGDALLPWLSERGMHRLKRWPDFGMLGSTHAHLALAAIATQRAHRVDELAALARQGRGTVVAFLNACAMCGLLESTADATAMPAARAPSASRIGTMFRSLRSALGIGA